MMSGCRAAHKFCIFDFNHLRILKTQASTIKLLLAFAAVYIIWGSTYLAIRFAIETVPPFLMAGVRFLIAGSILFIGVRVRDKEKIQPLHWRSAFIIGGLLLLGGNGGVVWAEQFVPSGLAALLVSTVPIWVVVINYVKPDREPPAVKMIAGIILGFAGLFFLISPYDFLSGDRIDLAGAAVLLMATFFWSLGSVYTKYAPLPKSSMLTVSMEMLAGGFLLFLVGFLFEDWSGVTLESVSSKSFLSIIYLIFFGSLVAFTAYIWLLEKAGPSRATTYAYVNPVVAVILGWAFAGEEMNLRIVISAVIIITAVAIIITDFSKLRKK
jgi:drug/metabolite transporter (DMT)-like permease